MSVRVFKYVLFAILFKMSILFGQTSATDSVKLYTTYTFTILTANPLTEKNATEIAGLFKPLPTVHYFNIEPKSRKLIVQVQEAPGRQKLVSSEIKQMILDFGDYELDHGFLVEDRQSLGDKVR